ncbi:MAG: hypothetical protein HYT16_04025 [DPANN group archaeon]|nr:hypothetical protein [DPANN group archaeon]
MINLSDKVRIWFRVYVLFGPRTIWDLETKKSVYQQLHNSYKAAGHGKLALYCAMKSGEAAARISNRSIDDVLSSGGTSMPEMELERNA